MILKDKEIQEHDLNIQRFKALDIIYQMIVFLIILTNTHTTDNIS